MVVLDGVDVGRAVVDGVWSGGVVKGRGVGCERSEGEFLSFCGYLIPPGAGNFENLILHQPSSVDVMNDEQVEGRGPATFLACMSCRCCLGL